MTIKEIAGWRTPPANALRKIEFGKLKGKSDINPQWRIDAMNERFGLCGIGWYYDIKKIETMAVVDGIYISAEVALYIKVDDGWSSPIIGVGGDMLQKRDKNGEHCNDDAVKGVITDAFGIACKYLGLAADVYRGLYETKYARKAEDDPLASNKNETAGNAQQDVDEYVIGEIKKEIIALIKNHEADLQDQLSFFRIDYEKIKTKNDAIKLKERVLNRLPIEKIDAVQKSSGADLFKEKK